MTQTKLDLSTKPENDAASAKGFLSSSPPSYEDATADVTGMCDEAKMLEQFSWDDRFVRRIFIRKVYSILLIQLLFTLTIVSLCTFCETVKNYVQSNPGWYWASYALFFATYLILSCCSRIRRKFPWNFTFLAVFTVSLSYMTGMLSSFYDTKSVVLCLGITAAVCFLVILFSFQTKFDMTSCHGVLSVFCFVMFISGLILAFVLPFNYIPWLDVTYAVLGAILFSLLLMFDTQLVMGNKQYAMSPEEYIFAALSIYLDIIYIFSFFLQIFGTKNSESVV